ncbi:MAG: esterase family protein, partial [Bacteroidetes bacterium]
MSHFRTLSLSDPRFTPEGLHHLTVKSRHLGSRADISLFVPQTDPLQQAPLPLVILLHGVYSSHWSWAFKGGAHLTAQRLIQSGRISPMVLAMPSDGLWGDGSGYVPHARQDFQSWIVEEVPLAVQELVERVTPDSPRFLAGLSMGGWGTLLLGAKFPQLWQGLSAHSAITQWNEMRFFVEEDIADFAP